MDYPISYPAFYIARGNILPHIPLPQNFRELVPRFYEQERRQIVEEYARNIEATLDRNPLVQSNPFGQPENPLKIRLTWDEKSGLKNICIGSAGLDLVGALGSSPQFTEHNLGTAEGFVTGIVALMYVSELIKSKYLILSSGYRKSL